MVDEAELRDPVIQFLKHRSCGVWLGIVVEKSRALSGGQCRRLQPLRLAVHLIRLPSRRFPGG